MKIYNPRHIFSICSAILVVWLFTACLKKDEDRTESGPKLQKCQLELHRVVAALPDLPPYKIPPRGNSQLNCVRSSTDSNEKPQYWYCTNTEGKWLCDKYGCEWKDKLPEGHPFLTPAPVEAESK